MRKQEILNRALVLFMEKGYDGASMSDIAAAVGIQKASLYAHYAGKELIFSAVFDDVLKEYRSMIDAFTQRRENEGALEQLARIFRAYILYCHQNVKMYFWDRYFYYPPEFIRERMARETKETQTEFICAIERLITEGIERGNIRRQSVSGAALAYYYLMIGLAMSVQLYDCDALERDIVLVWKSLSLGLQNEETTGE